MNVYIDNVLKNAAELSAANLSHGQVPETLFNEALENRAVFDGTHTVIEAEWGLHYYADTIALLESNWTTGRLRVYSQGELKFDQAVLSRGRQSFIRLGEAFMITGLHFELESVIPLEIGILFIGKKTTLPDFQAGFKSKLNIKGTSERTRYGIAYGLRRTSLQSFDISFKDLDDAQKEEMERYLDAVQFARPHIVEPYEGRPPLYATVSEGGAFEKAKYEFHWGTSLSYMEAR